MANPIKLGLESELAPLKYPNRLGKRENRIIEAAIKHQGIEDDFQQALVVSNFDNADGTIYTGATGEILSFNSGQAVYEVYQAAVASAAVIAPYQSVDGLELQVVAAADALELTNGTTALSKAAYVVGTDSDFFCEATIKIDDISDVTELFYGFRKAEAYGADPDGATTTGYAEMAAFNIGTTDDGRISIETRKADAAVAVTDTTLADIVDTGSHTFRVTVRANGSCEFSVDGAAPTVTQAFSLTDATTVIPFLHYNSETGDAGLSISSWRVGKL